MKTRIKYGLIAFLIFIPFLVLGGLPFTILTIGLGLLGMYELIRMAQIPVNNLVGVLTFILITLMILPNHYLTFLFGPINTVYFFYLSCLLLLILTVFFPQHLNFSTVAIITLGVIYIGTGFHSFILIREMGLEIIIYLLTVIWMTDMGAFFVGSAIGKHALAPKISPNKTIEGFLGGILFALMATNILFYFMTVPIPFVQHRWILTICLSIFGQLGDLVESAYKRHFNVKDSGKFIPGHGGVLDRFDSTLFVSIMFMIFLNLFN